MTADHGVDRGSRLALFRAILEKDILLLIRYPADTAARLVVTYFFFVIIFYGGKLAAGAAISETLDGLIVGYFLWTMSISAYQGLAGNVMSEAQWGTLQQLFMSPHGFGTVMAMKVAVNVFMSFLWGGSALALMLVTTGRTFTIDLLTVVPVAALAIGSVVGLGFALAGLAIVYKRVNNLVNLLQFGLVGLISAPAFDQPYAEFLPLVLGSGMLQDAMRRGVALWEFPPADLALLVATAVGYSLVGYYLFHRAQIRARRKGSLGEY